MKRKHTIRNEKRLTLGVLFLIYYLATLAIAIPARVCAGEETIATVSTTYHQRQNQYDSSSAKECVSSSIRGGGDGAYDDDDEATIRRFLQDPNNKISLDQFHVHGWRWHTMSLVREAKRLEKMADRYHDDNINNLGEKCCNSLKQATEYVVGFNLKGLHKIEADLFFPWMRNKLTTSSMIQAAATTTTTKTKTTTTDLVNAFGSIMDHLERDRQKVAKLGESIQQRIKLVCNESLDPSTRTNAIQGIASDSSSLEQYARSMMERENNLLVPAIAQIVPESEQKKFNNKVLKNLGLLDSRLHLVGMHEAVWESNIEKEKELFQKAIPSIPQMMIPRWKRNLYQPRTHVLDEE